MSDVIITRVFAAAAPQQLAAARAAAALINAVKSA
jgi:hypothetical protein